MRGNAASLEQHPVNRAASSGEASPRQVPVCRGAEYGGMELSVASPCFLLACHTLYPYSPQEIFVAKRCGLREGGGQQRGVTLSRNETNSK